MKIWALWYGGSSYGAPQPDDLEEFDSIEQARRVFQARYENLFGSAGTPCVDEQCEMHVFFSKPGDDPYPDRILTIGPRGGVKTE